MSVLTTSSIEDITRETLEHIRYLSEVIGPRPPGSEAEQKALDYAEQQISDAGLHPQKQYFSFRKHGFIPWITAAGLLFMLYAFLERPPVLALALPLALAAAPDLGRWSVRSSRGSARSANIYASLSQDKAPDLILCAHIDSAQAAVLSAPLLLRLRGRTFNIAQRAALFLAVLGVVELAGMRLFNPLPVFLSALAAVVGGWLIASEIIEQLAGTGRFSPGANDNGSGAGMVLALAKHFAGEAPESSPHSASAPNPGFLLTGAEEAGLHGARAFVKNIPEGTPVLSIDMIGSGSTLRFASRDGVFRRLHADPGLNSRIKQANPDARPLWYSLRSGDFAPFLEAGIPASALQVTGNPDADLRYHSSNDTLDGIEAQALRNTAETILKLINLS